MPVNAKCWRAILIVLKCKKVAGTGCLTIALSQAYIKVMTGFARFIVIVFLLAGFSAPAVAAYRITDQDRADIARIEAYLNTIESLRSRFVQLSTGGKVAEGTIL